MSSFMSLINASDVINNIENLNNNDFETSKNIMIDFSNIENIDLKAITALLNLQKIALMNNKSISIQNVNPAVSKILDVTGLNKTFANIATNPISGK